MKPYYTAKTLKELKSEMTILGTTNEQKNDHVKDWFSTNKILYRDRKLDTGDYNLMLPKNPENGRFQDFYFTDELFIERKNSLDELAQSNIREAFHHELKRAQLMKHKYLIVEQIGGWWDIANHAYSSDYDHKAFFKTLHGFMIKYDLRVIFCEKSQTASHIYTICDRVLEQYLEK